MLLRMRRALTGATISPMAEPPSQGLATIHANGGAHPGGHQVSVRMLLDDTNSSQPHGTKLGQKKDSEIFHRKIRTKQRST